LFHFLKALDTFHRMAFNVLTIGLTGVLLDHHENSALFPVLNNHEGGCSDAAGMLQTIDTRISHAMILKDGFWSSTGGAENQYHHHHIYTSGPEQSAPHGCPKGSEGDTSFWPHAAKSQSSLASASSNVPHGQNSAGVQAAQPHSSALDTTHAGQPSASDGAASSTAAAQPHAASLDGNVVEVKDGFWPAHAANIGGGSAGAAGAGGRRRTP
jgi:hypothetical protein